ncbi:unnamed protein product [Caretta caretta]
MSYGRNGLFHSVLERPNYRAAKKCSTNVWNVLSWPTRENVTVIAELPLTDSQQFLEDRTDLLGLKEENHKAEITVILLKTQVVNSLPVVIGSSVGGFLLLAFIIFILFKQSANLAVSGSSVRTCIY